MLRHKDNQWMQPERRQSMRIVTLRNFGWLSIALLVAFAAITIRSEMRGRHMHDYGRLYGRQITRDVAKKEPVEVVTEAQAAAATGIADQTPAVEPMLVLPADPLDGTIAAEPQQQATIISPSVAPRARESRVAIVGGAEGVTVVQQTHKRPLLAGGFGR